MWVRATDEFLGALSCSRYMHIQKIEEKRSSESSGKQEPLINQVSYLNIAEDGLVSSVKYEKDTNTTTASSKQRGRKPEEDVTKRSFKELCRQTKRPVWLLGCRFAFTWIAPKQSLP